MKKTLIFTWLIGILFFVCVTDSSASNNKTVMTTSDSAPTYNNGQEVVIGSSSSAVSTKVFLTTTCDAGDSVTLNSTNYHCSAGVTMASGYPTGIGSAKEVAKFDFDSTTIGKVNTITIDPPLHTSTGTGGATITCNSPSGPVAAGGLTFTICIPKITIVITTTGANDSNLYRRTHTYNVIGVDDLSQVKILPKMYNQTTQLNETTGASFAPTDPGNGFYNSGGWVNDPTTLSGPFTPTKDMTDPHETDVTTSHGAVVGVNSCYYCYVTWREFDGDMFVTRASGGAQMAETKWGYKWDNYDAQMGTAGNPALPSDVAAAAFVNWDTSPPSNKASGEFYSWYVTPQ